MNSMLTFFLLIYCAGISFVQEKEEPDDGFLVGNVICDSSSLEEESNDRTELPALLSSRNAIEIRFFSQSEWDFDGAVLFYDTQWRLKIHQDAGAPSGSGRERFEEELVKPETWKYKTVIPDLDTLFSKLVENNLFSLPDDSTLPLEKYYFNPKTNIFTGEGIGVGCGAFYAVEFKIGDKYRRYTFSNPDVYASFYPTVHELQNYVNIVTLFVSLINEEPER